MVGVACRVDLATGEVNVEQLATVADCGYSSNPRAWRVRTPAELPRGTPRYSRSSAATVSSSPTRTEPTSVPHQSVTCPAGPIRCWPNAETASMSTVQKWQGRALNPTATTAFTVVAGATGRGDAVPLAPERV